MENKATITFSNNEKIVIHELDRITPNVKESANNENFASMAEGVYIESHVYDGLIPFLLDVFLYCEYFFVGSDHTKAYSTKAIVKIERGE